MKFLSYDSKFGQLLLKLCYSCWLNILWLVCCLPVFTAGAATTALWYVCLKCARGEETSVTSMFFRAFKENFKQATALWLIMLPVGVLLGVDVWVLYRLFRSFTGTLAVIATLGLALVVAACVLYVIVLIYLFPLVASVANTNGAMLKNAFLVGTRYLFSTILVFGVHFAMLILVVRVYTPLILLGEGLCVMVSAHFVYKIIDLVSYDPDKPPEDPS